MDPKPTLNSSRILPSDLELDLPRSDVPLVEGPGPPVTWAAWMAETALETKRYLERYGRELPPPPLEEPFRLD